jgi:5'-nucleotidase
VAQYDEQITPIESRVIGTAATDITRAPAPAGEIVMGEQRVGESALGDLIADAQRADADIAFMNPDNIRQDIQAGDARASRPWAATWMRWRLMSAASPSGSP